MRTATRIALVLMGTATFVAAMATPGARAGRNLLADHKPAPLIGMMASQRPQRQPRPDRIDYVRAAEVVSYATAIARLPLAPQSSNARRGDQRIESQFALATASDKARNRAIAWPAACDRETFAAQQINASDGGRGTLAGAAEDGSCSTEDRPKRRTRQAIVGDIEQMPVPRSDPTPVVIRFEAIISIDLAGLNW